MCKSTKIFITGITGFVGRNLSEELLNKGYDIVGFLRKSVMYRKPKIYSYLREKNTKIVYGDITNFENIKKALNEISKEDKDLIVVHLAALGNSKNVDLLRQVNVNGTENLCRVILKSGSSVKQIIHFSTAAVCGPHHPNVKITEKMDIYNPETPYEKTKYAGEKIAEKFMKEDNLPITILRPVHVYGPHNFDSIVKMIEMVRRGFVIAPTKLPLDLVYVKNLVQAVVLAIKKRQKAEGETYFITDGKSYITDDLIKNLETIYGKEHIVIHLPRLATKIYSKFTKQFRYGLNNVSFSCDKIIKNLGYAPKYSLLKGLEDYISWLTLERERMKN